MARPAAIRMAFLHASACRVSTYAASATSRCGGGLRTRHPRCRCPSRRCCPTTASRGNSHGIRGSGWVRPSSRCRRPRRRTARLRTSANRISRPLCDGSNGWAGSFEVAYVVPNHWPLKVAVHHRSGDLDNFVAGRRFRTISRDNNLDACWVRLGWVTVKRNSGSLG